MFNASLVLDYRQAPRWFLDLYIEQLFGHNGYQKIATCENIDPCTWITRTCDSYNLWLSYVKLGAFEGRETLRVKDYQPTNHTPEQEGYLKDASQEDVNAYVDWAFPTCKINLWKEHFPGGHIKYFVSPVHFWFFMLCRRRTPLRPLHPKTTDNLFRHPLFLVTEPAGPFSLVVPEYFFQDHTDFDGLGDLNSVSCYVFPYFGQRLIEYVKRPPAERYGSFSSYYAARQNAWFAPSMVHFTKPHSVLRRNWRWEEVLEMIWSWKRSGNACKPRGAQSAPPGYLENPQIAAYLDCFAEVAGSWVERWIEPST